MRSADAHLFPDRRRNKLHVDQRNAFVAHLRHLLLAFPACAAFSCRSRQAEQDYARKNLQFYFVRCPQARGTRAVTSIFPHVQFF
jgi:hypothetical protein